MKFRNMTRVRRWAALAAATAFAFIGLGMTASSAQAADLTPADHCHDPLGCAE